MNPHLTTTMTSDPAASTSGIIHHSNNVALSVQQPQQQHASAAGAAPTSSNNNDDGNPDDAVSLSTDDNAADGADDTQTVMTMDDVVEHIGFGAFHWKLLWLCGVGYFAEITELVVVSFVAPSIQRQMGLTDFQYGCLGSSSFVGMAVGAFFWGFVSDHLGRQLSFTWTVWLTFFGGFCSALAPNYGMLLFLRFTAAFGIGGMLPVDYTVFLEFLPNERRGSYIVLVDAIGVVPALTLSASIAWYFAGEEHVEWRGVLLISSIPVGIMALLRRHVPESPRYHLAAGERDAAQQVVQSVADTNSVPLPDDWRLLTVQESMELERERAKNDQSEKNIAASQSSDDQGAYVSLPNPSSPETEFTNLSRDGLQPQHPPSSSPRIQDGTVSYHNDTSEGDAILRTDDGGAGHSFDELLRDPMLRHTSLRLWMLYFLVQLSSAGMVFALPKLFDEHFPGKTERDIALDLLIGVIGLIPGLAIAFVAIEKSRTKTLAAFLFAAGVAVACLGWSFLVLESQRWSLFFSIVLRGAMEGCFAVLNTTAVESYPTLLRASGLGTAQIFDHIAGSLSPVVFSALDSSPSTQSWVFGLYAVSYIVATLPALTLNEHVALDY